MKTILIISWLLFAGSLAFGGSLLEVRTGETHQWKELLNVHESPIPWLSVGGKKYMHVMRMMDPCYLKIPGRDQILFVTSNEQETGYTYHFVSLTDGKDIAVPVEGTGLYLHFGYTDPKRQPAFELVDGGKLVIVVRFPNFSRRYRFDLEARTAIEEQGDDGWDKIEKAKSETPNQPSQPTPSNRRG